MSTHSCVIAPHLKDALSTGEDGKYGRMFPDLPSPETDETILLTLGKSGSIMDAASRVDVNDASTDNSRIPAGFTFLGQFVAHDITADRSLLLHHAHLNELHNFPTPSLPLESLSAPGPTFTPPLYHSNPMIKFF